MRKIISAFSLHWHYVLDILLTHVYVIAFLHAGYSSIAGLLMAVDSLYRAIFMVFISRFTAQLAPWIRGRISVFLRMLLVVIWFVAIHPLSIHVFSLFTIFPFIVFKVILAIDSSLSSDFIFRLKEFYSVDITQSSAAQNILIRSSTAAAPAFALTLFTVPQMNLTTVIIVVIIGIMSTMLLRNVFFTSRKIHTVQHQNKHIPFNKLIDNPLMRWGLLFQITGNLAFAGVAFLLLAQLKLQGGVFLNEITALYAFFFIMQCIVLLFGDRMIPVTQPNHVALIMAICGLCVLFLGVTHGTERLLMCGATGLVYSLLLSASQKVITSQLKGNGFIEYQSWAMATGRISSFCITVLLGTTMSAGFSSTTLLMICGILGLLSAIFLGFLKR